MDPFEEVASTGETYMDRVRANRRAMPIADAEPSAQADSQSSRGTNPFDTVSQALLDAPAITDRDADEPEDEMLEESLEVDPGNFTPGRHRPLTLFGGTPAGAAFGEVL